MIAVLASVIISGFVSASIVRMNSSMFKGLASSEISLQAQQYAESEATMLRHIEYKSLVAHAKNEITGSNGYFSEVVLSDESEFGNGIKQRSAVVNIYKNAEVLPRVSLSVVRNSVEEKSSGVPVGTIIVWPGSNAPTDGGTWLLCNGQSCVAYPSLSAVVGNNVPNLNGRFLEGTTSIPGSFKEAGLPNITGNLGLGINDRQAAPGGVFFTTTTKYYRVSTDSAWSALLQFSASRSNSIYGNSATVQPASYTVRYYIKAA